MDVLSAVFFQFSKCIFTFDHCIKYSDNIRVELYKFCKFYERNCLNSELCKHNAASIICSLREEPVKITKEASRNMFQMRF